VLSNMKAYLNYVDVRSVADDPLTLVDENDASATSPVKEAPPRSKTPSKKGFFEKYFTSGKSRRQSSSESVGAAASAAQDNDDVFADGDSTGWSQLPVP
jgi:hypothetical protein